MTGSGNVRLAATRPIASAIGQISGLRAVPRSAMAIPRPCSECLRSNNSSSVSPVANSITLVATVAMAAGSAASGP